MEEIWFFANLNFDENFCLKLKLKMKTNIENRLLNILETECQNIGIIPTEEEKELFLDSSFDLLILEFNLSCKQIESLLLQNKIK